MGKINDIVKECLEKEERLREEINSFCLSIQAHKPKLTKQLKSKLDAISTEVFNFKNDFRAMYEVSEKKLNVIRNLPFLKKIRKPVRYILIEFEYYMTLKGIAREFNERVHPINEKLDQLKEDFDYTVIRAHSEAVSSTNRSDLMQGLDALQALSSENSLGKTHFIPMLNSMPSLTNEQTLEIERENTSNLRIK